MVDKVKYGLTLGKAYKSRNCGEFIISYINTCNDIGVTFKETGTVSTTTAGNIRKGSVGDKRFPTFFGVGYLGYGDYKTRIGTYGGKTENYQKWENMLARCYYPKTARYSAYGGSGVTVCKEWLNFQTFSEWFEDNYIKGQHLDKDIFGDGNLYSPETCCFIPQHINGLFVNNFKNRKKLYDNPTGVHMSRGFITSSVSMRGVNQIRETFNSTEDAESYYANKKTQVVREAVNKSYLEGELCQKVYDKLKDYKFIKQEEKIDE